MPESTPTRSLCSPRVGRRCPRIKLPRLPRFVTLPLLSRSSRDTLPPLPRRDSAGADLWAMLRTTARATSGCPARANSATPPMTPLPEWHGWFAGLLHHHRLAEHHGHEVG